MTSDAVLLRLTEAIDAVADIDGDVLVAARTSSEGGARGEVAESIDWQHRELADILLVLDHLGHLPADNAVWRHALVRRTLGDIVRAVRARQLSAVGTDPATRRYSHTPVNPSESLSTTDNRNQLLGDVAVEPWRTLSVTLEANHSARPLILCLLLTIGTEQALLGFIQAARDAPLTDLRAAIEPFGMLFQLRPTQVRQLFPGILDILCQATVAGLVLDFCNFAYRRHDLPAHPAASRAAELISLLGQIADRLRMLQEQPNRTADEVARAGRQVTESVPFAISLCDALALIGNTDAVGALYKATEVEHRRLRVEAAAALVSLGEESGKKMLAELAAEPIERLRVLAYAEELSIVATIDVKFTSAAAIAEAALANRLAEPTQFGLPPREMECIDQRLQMWPGYDEPVECFLFRYEYVLPDESLQNIGIAGPVVFNMIADLTDLTVEETYWLFAGWDVEHSEIVMFDSEHVPASRQSQARRLLAALDEAEEYQNAVMAGWGMFFDELVLIAHAVRQDHTGIVVVSSDRFDWIPIRNRRRPIGPMEAFYLFVGRQLFKAFSLGEA